MGFWVLFGIGWIATETMVYPGDAKAQVRKEITGGEAAELASSFYRLLAWSLMFICTLYSHGFWIG